MYEPAQVASSGGPPTDVALDAALVACLMEGDSQGALAEARRLKGTQASGERRVLQALERAMDGMSEKCTTEQFNLLEIMLAGRAATAVAHDLFPQDDVPGTKGTVVIATPEGDVHDLGKNLTRMVLAAKGFHVVDCGKDCPLPVMIRAVAQERAFALLVSGLISPMVVMVRQLRPLLREQGLAHVRVLAGGAALKQCTAEVLNVDYVASDAFDGARDLEAFLRERP